MNFEHLKGHVLTAMSWMFAIIQPSIIPLILSSTASVMACVSYYFQIKKNRKT